MSTVVEEQTLAAAEPTVPRVPKGFELIDGVLVEKNMSLESSWIGGEIFRLIANYSQETGVGLAFPPETGCQCFKDSPRTVRKPDTLFVKAGRLVWDQVGEGWLRIAPDLIVEVNSPNDLAEHVEVKIERFRKAGVPLLWIVSPSARTVRVLRADGSSATLREEDQLSGEDIIPGFTCLVASIFPPRTPTTPAEAQPTA